MKAQSTEILVSSEYVEKMAGGLMEHFHRHSLDQLTLQHHPALQTHCNWPHTNSGLHKSSFPFSVIYWPTIQQGTHAVLYN